MRNSITHCSVYMIKTGNRKFILFENFNRNNKLTARILLSQTDLQSLRTLLREVD